MNAAEYIKGLEAGLKAAQVLIEEARISGDFKAMETACTAQRNLFLVWSLAVKAGA